jgi:Uma2 family endonuclease
MHAAKLATFDDLLALPEGERAEIVGGVLVTPPSSLPRHGRAQRVVGRVIGGAFDDDDGVGGPGGWWILPEVDVRLTPHDIVRPDVAGWRRARLEDPWDLRPIDVVPDWIGEILSPSNIADDRVRKRRLYADHGVAFYSSSLRRYLAVRRSEPRYVRSGPGRVMRSK